MIRQPIPQRSGNPCTTSHDPIAGLAVARRVRHGLARLCRGLPSGSTLTMLDVGTGLGDLPADAVRWGASRGIRLVPFGLERSRPAAELARDAGLPMVLGCAGSLPIKRGSVDIVVLSQVAHHLHGDAVISMARELTSVARIGVVLADLRRSRLAMLGFWIGSRLLRFDPATRADGLTSVRRSYTRMELKTLLSRGRHRCDRRAAAGFPIGRHLAQPMRTVDERRMRAPADAVFQAVSDVERWPELLPHYRWVRILERRPESVVVEMAAWRPFGVLRYPTWWVSEMWVRPADLEVRYRHIRGITRGMDVVWRLVPGGETTDVSIIHEWNGPSWPLIGRPAAELVIGPVFVHGIASRTLAGIARHVEAAAMGNGGNAAVK